MKKALVTLIATVSVAMPATAADYGTLRGPIAGHAAPRTFVPQWSAIYGGIHLGSVFGNTVLDSPALRGFTSGSGFMAGGQIGADVQIDNFVYGAVVDVSYTGPRQTIATISYSLAYQGSARLRLGYLITPAFLLYGTGGLAFGSDRIEDTSTRFDNARGHIGWTIGAGGEYLFANSWSAFGEYRYTDLGAASWINGPVGAVATDLRSANHTVRAGLNYRFSAGGESNVVKNRY